MASRDGLRDKGKMPVERPELMASGRHYLLLSRRSVGAEGPAHHGFEAVLLACVLSCGG